MTEQQKERLDKQALLEWLNNLAGTIYVHDISNAITLGRFNANDSEAIKGWGECEAQNQQLRDELAQENKDWLEHIAKDQQERHELFVAIESMRSELAAKDKALRMIANDKVHACESAYQLTQIAKQTLGDKVTA